MNIRLVPPEALWDRIRGKWDNLLKIGLFTFALGILSYIQMITGWLTNPDGVWQGIIYKPNYGWEDSLGRIGLGIFNKLKGFFIYPALQTIFCLMLVSLITMLLCGLFQIHHRLFGGVLGFLMICSPFMCNLLTYYYTADAYMVAYLLSVLFVCILVKKTNIQSILVAAVLLACSLSLYQAYLGTGITLCLVYLLYRLIKANDGWKKILCQGGCFLISGCLGTACYLLVYKIYCSWQGIQPTADRGFASMGKIPIQSLWPLIKQAYIYFVDYYFTDNLINNSWRLRDKCNLIVFVVIATVVIVLLWRRRNTAQTILLAVLFVVLLPLAFMSIVVMAPEVSITEVTGILMIPHMNFIFLFLIALVAGESDGWKLKICAKWISLAVLSYMAFAMGLYVQIFQNCMRMELNRDYALAQRVLAQVESLPEYSPGMKLMIGGNAEKGNYPRNYQEMYYVVSGTVATYGYFWDSTNGRQNCWIEFLRNYLGVSYSVCSSAEVNAIMESGEYMDMPVFPEAGSVRMINGHAVVKLSEE